MCAPAAPQGDEPLARKPWGLSMAAGRMVMEELGEGRGGGGGCGWGVGYPSGVDSGL